MRCCLCSLTERKLLLPTKKRYGVRLDWRSFDAFNRKCDELPLGGNLAPLIGYSAVRTAVMGRDCMRQAAEGEVAS